MNPRCQTLSTSLRWIAALLFFGTSGCANDVLNDNEQVPSILVTVESATASDHEVDEASLHVDLGDVPLLGIGAARYRVKNEGTARLEVFAVEYGLTEGQTWARPVAEPLPPGAYGASPAVDFGLQPGEELVLAIPYSPLVEGPGSASIFILSNDPRQKRVVLEVEANGTLDGTPDIEIEYAGYVGPAPGNCNADGEGVERCIVPAAQALDFGNIIPGATGMQRITVRNVAACAGDDARTTNCSRCALAIRPNPNGDNLGLSFASEEPGAGSFAFYPQVTLPLVVGARDIECGEEGELEIQVAFHASTTRGPAATTLTIESTDPDEPLIEIPITAYVTESPVAVADFMRCGVDASPPACSNPSELEPLERVYLHGDDSYEPPNPPNPDDISTYQWTVLVSPPGSNPDDFALQGRNASHFSFETILAGHYVVQLTVWNQAGVESGDTASSRLEFDVIPADQLHLQLVWEDDANDMDLHLSNVDLDTRVCSAVGDCHYKNCMESCLDPAGCHDDTVWFGDHPAFTGPNPVLDRDDTRGRGPENLNIDTPRPGTYRIYVHYWTDYGTPKATPSTVRIYANGMLYAEYTRTMPERNSVWAVATVTWNGNGTPTITPYPSDATGQIGSIESMSSGCQLPGWYFP